MVELNLIGSNITSVSARRNEFTGEVTVKSNIKVTSFEKMPSTKDTLKISYGFDIDYGDLGNINIEGNVYLKTNPKILKEIITSWENKKFDTEEQIAITNIILKKSTLKAFQLEEELGLPTHIKLPSVQLKDK